MERPIKHPDFFETSSRRLVMKKRSFLYAGLLLLLNACGGGGGGGGGTAPPPPTPVATPTPTAVGVPAGDPVSATIGAAGGSLSTADGKIVLTIPAGALAADTVIGIQPITNTAPLGLGSAYRLTPDGARFAQPVKLTFRYTVADTAGSSTDALALAFQDAEGHWRRFGPAALDEAQGTVSTDTTHFTDFSMLLGWQLRPPQANVSPLGTLELTLKYCEPETFYDPDGGDPLSGLVPRCDSDDELALPHLVTVSGWAVNGKPGGSVGDGSVSGRGQQATYTAPGAVPAQNPVAVSCDISHGRGRSLAVANVTVGTGGWSGTIRWTVMGTFLLMVGTTTETWTANGSGQLRVRPGMFGLGEVESATFTYAVRRDERTTNMYVQNNCNHSLVQTRVETLSGTATAGATVVIQAMGPGNTSISFGLPSGQTMGEIVVDATDTVTGPMCTSPMPTHTVAPTTGVLPRYSFSYTSIESTGDLISGSTTVHAEGSPPLDYAITYELSR